MAWFSQLIFIVFQSVYLNLFVVNFRHHLLIFHQQSFLRLILIKEMALVILGLLS